jgi:hypothetical protein
MARSFAGAGTTLLFKDSTRGRNMAVLGGGEEVEAPSGSRRQALCEQGWSESALRYEARSLPNNPYVF